MAGTDIYIISGIKKPPVTTVEFRNDAGWAFRLPTEVVEEIRRSYGRKHAIGATITADSTPDYDDLGWDDYWPCSTWMLWHQLNVQKYGQAAANQKFIDAWGAQDGFMSPYNWCKYDNEFANYFNSQGIDVGWLLSHLLVTVDNVTDDATEVITNTSSTAASLTRFAKAIAPWAAVGVGVWVIDKWVYPIFSKR